MAESEDRRSGWGLGILILLGVLLGTSGPSGTPTSQGEGGPRSSAAAERADKGDADGDGEDDTDYRRPYLDFRDFHGTAAPEAAEKGLDLGRLIARDASRMAPEFLIVTVPEPVDSRFGYRFDAILDAVQLAIESQGWNLDRFWLPWLPSGRQFNDRKDLKPALDRDKGAELYERKPGVLLFRQSRKKEDPDQRQRVLVVLLVSETPTSGVAKGALAGCLTIIRSYHQGVREGIDRVARLVGRAGAGIALLQEMAPAPLSGVRRSLAVEGALRVALTRLFSADLGRVDVRIVGPMFSGSEQSLALTLSQWLEENRGDASWSWDLFIRSGDADRIVKEKFERDAGGGRFPNVRVEYDSTLVHIDAVLKALFDFLKTLNGAPLGKVALLTESDTRYGRLSREDTEAWTGPGTTVTTMTFPFHVSQVAVAYNQGDQKDNSSTPMLIRPSTRLSIPFDEVGKPRDVVPALSPAMTTATNSFVLAKILETISMEDFRYIGIIATDTRDTIFLADLIRQFCPDVQLFSPAGDLLLGHPRYAYALRGMIVATPYPLFSMAQRWDPPHEGDHRRHLFSHQGDQGTFNATVSLLYRTGRREANPNCAFFESLYDYGLPFDELADLSAIWQEGPDGRPSWLSWKADHPGPIVRKPSGVPCAPPDRPGWALTLDRPEMRPAIWFSVIGQRGLWPIAYEDVGTRPVNKGYTFNASYTKTIDADQFAGQFPALVPQFTWQWGTVFLGLSAVAWLLFVVHARFALGRRARFVPGLSWTEALRPSPAAGRAQREVYALAGLLGFLAVYAFCALRPSWIAARYSPWPLFLDGRLWDVASRNDHWNIRFAWLALYSGHVTALALAWTIAGRVWSMLGPDRERSSAGVLSLVPGPILEKAAGRLRSWRGRGLSDEERLAAVVLADAAVLATICLPPALLLRTLFEARWAYRPEQFAPLLSFERAVNFGSGVSPLMPVLMLMLVGTLWLWCQLRRLDLGRRFWGFARVDGPGAPGRGASPSGSLRDRALRFSKGQEGHVSIPTRPADRDTEAKDDRGPDRAVATRVAARPAPSPVVARQAPSPVAARPSSLPGLYTPDDGPAKDRLRRVGGRVEVVKQLVGGWLPPALLLRPPVLAAVGLVVIASLRLVQRALPGVDFPGWWTTVIMAAVAFLALTIVVTLSRFVCLWMALGEVLRELVRWPMAAAYDRIPAPYAETLGRYLDRARPSLESLHILVQQWEAVAGDFYEVADLVEARGLEPGGAPAGASWGRIEKAITTGDPDAAALPARGTEAARAIAERYDRELRGEDCDGRDEIAASPTWIRLRNAARACIAALEPFWESRAAADGFGAEPEGKAGASEANGNGRDEALRRWVRQAEDLIALEVVMLAGQGSVHLKNMAYYLAIAPILLLMSVSTYPLQPQRFLQVGLWAILVAVVVTVVTVYVRMERDELLSRVSGTSPNRIEFDRTFLSNVLAFIIPLVGVALAKFPYVSDSLNQWLEPISGVLK